MSYQCETFFVTSDGQKEKEGHRFLERDSNTPSSTAGFLSATDFDGEIGSQSTNSPL